MPILRKQTRTILEELTQAMPKQDHGLLLESRGSHLIASVFNLLESVKNSHGDEAVLELERRLISSIRSRDSAKFLRGIRRINHENQ